MMTIPGPVGLPGALTASAVGIHWASFTALRHRQLADTSPGALP